MRKTRFWLFILLIVLATPLFLYINYINKQKSEIEHSIYASEMAIMQKNVASAIEEKKKATTAIAITLASNDALHLFVHDKEKLKSKIDSLTDSFRKNTDYKNVWFHIVDSKYRSLYQSWTKANASTVTAKEFRIVIAKHKILSLINVDPFGVSIKALAPFYDNKGNVAGAVEVISHFNSIAKRLHKLDINSVVVVTKEMSKKIKHPFTRLFIYGCYVANFDIDPAIITYMREHGIDDICKEKYQVRDGYIIVAYPLKDLNNKVIAHYIMLKKTVDISKTDLQFFLFKGIVFGFGLFVLFLIVSLVYFYLRTRKLKKYYKSIIDSTTNILLICDGHTLISVNKVFFHYFRPYKDIQDFKKEHSCICDFFVEEEGYIQKYVEGEYWIDYIKKHPNFYHKAKLLIGKKVYYFSLSLSTIANEEHHSLMILSDITEQELYKKELEHLTLVDPLTHIGNRRKYEKRLEEERSRACRYKTPLSLIVLDLDHFKKVNDEYGHSVGDEVLREYSKLVKNALRGIDEIFRIGGEEFVVLAPHTAKKEAMALAEKLRKLIEEHKKIVPVTASFGVSEFEVCEDKESFFTRADEALYKAKSDGRNRVVAL
jgi:diguanylate cyclase (GGDEF)-like protein